MESFFKKSVDFFLFSSIFIALCAVCMVYQTFFLFDVDPYLDFVFFVFFGSLCSYNFHWYLTPGFYGGSYKTQWSVSHKNLHLGFFLAGLIGAGWFGFKLLDHWQWLIVTAFITFLYSAPKIPFQPFTALKKVAVGKTIFLSLVWTHTTSILPLVLRNIQWQDEHFIFLVNRFFLIYPICILFDYRDREEDRKDGIKSMITFFSDKNITIVFYSSLLVFFMSTVALFFSGLSLLNTVALFIPGLIVACVYNYSKKETSDYWYYLFLDGLMMFSAVLLYIFSFGYI